MSRKRPYEKANRIRQKKIYSFLMNCAAPVLTVIFLAGSVCWAAEIQYGETEEFDSNPEAAAVLSPSGLVPESAEIAETSLPENSPLTGVTENTGAELVEACGVYIDNDFVGAVVSGERIEEELQLVLDNYKSDESVIEADYAVEPQLKQGVYRSAALVSSKDMADYLTGEKEVVTEYTADEGDTPEKLAKDFGMTVDEVKKLNPEIGKLEEGESVKVRETVPVLPVKYTREETEEEELVLLDESVAYYGGECIESGRKINRYEVTYIDGAEIERKLTDSETIFEQSAETEDGLYSESLPETEEIAVETGLFVWPVNGGYISDPFMSDRNHKGMDIAAESGTDIYAAAGGTVTDAGWNDGGYGNYVVIDHGNGYVTLYGHASEVYVSAGQTVSAGELIAAVGTTGDSTGNHCHFEVIYSGCYLDPADFIM